MDLYRLGARILPRRLRAGIRSSALRLLHSDPEVEALRRRVSGLEAALFQLTPDVLPQSPEVERTLAYFREQHGIEGPLDTAISKRDVMYRYIEHWAGDAPSAVWQYLETGLQAFQALDRVVAEGRNDPAGLAGLGSLLDFASGYGRITRFFVRALAPERIWVSDIKAQGVDFQAERLGVQGFPSPVRPDELRLPRDFDLIFCASFFTHLPEHSWGEWLATLQRAVAPGGLLVFSVHDLGILDDPERPDFVFRENNEEMMFPFVDDTLTDTGEYGSTYVSEAYVRGAAAKLGLAPYQVQRHRRALWDLQDLYVFAPGRDEAP